MIAARLGTSAQPNPEESRIRRAMTLAAAALALSYPFLVYFGWQRVNPRLFVGGAIIVLSVRFFASGARVNREMWKDVAWPWLFPAGFLGVTFLIGRRSLFLYWPAVMSATFLFIFGNTLRHPPPLVERFARLQKPNLTPAEIGYCRKVTQLWCLFLTGNAVIALVLTQRNLLKAWTLYNGLISYFLIGSLMTLEFVYRHWRFRPEGARLTRWMDRWSR